MTRTIHTWRSRCWLVLLLVPGNQLVAQGDRSIFDLLAGEWVGEGTLMQRPAAFTLSWENTTGFTVLKFTNAFVNDGEITPVLRAVAIYRRSSTQPEAVWMDSRGERVEITWSSTDHSLISEWRSPSEAGRTTYRVLSDDELEVVDEVMSGGSMRTFGTAKYERVIPQN